MTNDKRALHPTDESSALLIYPDKGKVMGVVCLGIVLIAVGVVITFVPSPRGQDAGAHIIGLLLIVAMGGGTISSIVRLVSSTPALVIDHAGILINSTLFRIGVIEWGDIAQLVAYPSLFNTRLAIVVADPRPLLARQPLHQRAVYMLVKGNLMRSGRIVINDALLPMAMNELLAKIRERYHHELLHYHIAIYESHEK